MQTAPVISVPESTAARPAARSLPARFFSRLLMTVPLVAVAGWCLLGFVATFEPMPRIAQFAWRGIYICAGLGSMTVVGWLWLKSRRA